MGRQVRTFLGIVGLLCVGNLALTGTLSPLRVGEFVGGALLAWIVGMVLARRPTKPDPPLKVAWVDDDGNLKWKDWDGTLAEDAAGEGVGNLDRGEPGQPRSL